MTERELTRELILSWAYGNIDIWLYESGDDGDAALFDDAVERFFDLDEFLHFCADPDCLMRSYFAAKLARGFIWAIAWQSEFRFPTLCGIPSKDDFSFGALERISQIYKYMVVLDKMQKNEDVAVRLLCRQILEFRNDGYMTLSEFYRKCSQKLDLDAFY